MKRAFITGGNVGHGINYNVTATYNQELDKWVVEENGEVIGYYSNEQIDMFAEGEYNTKQYIYNVEFIS